MYFSIIFMTRCALCTCSSARGNMNNQSWNLIGYLCGDMIKGLTLCKLTSCEVAFVCLVGSSRIKSSYKEFCSKQFACLLNKKLSRWNVNEPPAWRSKMGHWEPLLTSIKVWSPAAFRKRSPRSFPLSCIGKERRLDTRGSGNRGYMYL